jgi:hypothetical protein
LREVGIRPGNDQRIVVSRNQEHRGNDLEESAEHLPCLGRDPLVRPRTVEQITRHQHRVRLLLARHFREGAKRLEDGFGPRTGVRGEGGERGSEVYVSEVQDTHHGAYDNG